MYMVDQMSADVPLCTEEQWDKVTPHRALPALRHERVVPLLC